MKFDQFQLAAFDDASDYILLTDAQLDGENSPKILFANKAFLLATGYEAEEVLGRSPRIMQGEGTDRGALDRIRRALEAGEPVQETLLNYTKTKCPYWVELNIRPICDAMGTPTHFLSIQRDITEAQTAREAAELDRRLAALGERVGRSGTWGFDLKHDRVICSEGCYEIFKRDKRSAPPDIDGFRALLDERSQELMDRLTERCVIHQEPFEAEITGHAEDGTPLDILFSGEAMVGEDGRTSAVVGAVRDISEEKRAKRELQSANAQNQLLEQNFAAARKTAKIGVFDYDIEADLQHWTDELFEMTGLGKAKFPAAAEEFIKRVDSADRPMFDAHFERAIEHGEGYQIVVRFHRPDGKIMHMRIHADVIDHGRGRRVVGVARDVTDDVVAADLLMRQEERFRIIADVMSDIIWDYSFEGEKLWVSPNWPERLDIAVDEKGFDPDNWTETLLQSDRNRAKNSLTEAIKSSAKDWSCEYKVASSDGSSKHLEARAAIIRDDRGFATRLVGSLRDITDEKMHDQRMARARTLEAIGQLTGGFAHDFNNLLMIVQGNAEILQMGDLNEDDLKSAQLIEQAARSGAALTRSLLSFSGQNEMRKKRLDLGQLFQHLTVLLKAGLTDHTRLVAEIDTHIWDISADAQAFEQAILNLVLNARDAMPDGGEITINCVNQDLSNEVVGGTFDLEPGRYVCITVSDNGTGMDEQTMAKAFDPFFTTRPVGEGTGLGLSSVYGFAEQSDGAIQICSELGHGTTINLYLPAAETRDNARIEGPVTRDAQRIGNHSDTFRILVVEDKPQIRDHLVAVLARAGHLPVSASDAAAALRILEGDAGFDLLLTDIIMPGGLNGVQLALKAATIAPTMKVLFISGFPAAAFDEIGIERDDEFRLLKKPFSSSELLETVLATVSDDERI